MLDIAILAAALNRDSPVPTYGPAPQSAPVYAELKPRPHKSIDNRPGQIQNVSPAPVDRMDDGERGRFVCADDDCKTVLPVYKSETPLQQEQSRLSN